MQAYSSGYLSRYIVNGDMFYVFEVRTINERSQIFHAGDFGDVLDSQPNASDGLSFSLIIHK